MPRLYLASKSPRRREILASMGVTDIEILAAGPLTPGAFAADTAVIFNGEVLGKPVDREEARSFMNRLSGRTHEVRTAVAAGFGKESLLTAVSVSEVHFCTLEPEQIEAYIATEEPYDKAGGYGIQGLAGLFIDRIAGSYTGIMGLPVYETGRLLRALGVL